MKIEVSAFVIILRSELSKIILRTNEDLCSSDAKKLATCQLLFFLKTISTSPKMLDHFDQFDACAILL
jgi:hypothetical protein